MESGHIFAYSYLVDYKISVKVELPGQDTLTLDFDSDGKPIVKVIGCSQVKRAVEALSRLDAHPAKWSLPTENNHADLLIREFILKSQGKWPHPYQQIEMCHCRVVTTERVETAIINGAHTTERVSRETSASTSCGSCRPDVQKVIDFRLMNPSVS